MRNNITYLYFNEIEKFLFNLKVVHSFCNKLFSKLKKFIEILNIIWS